ncbi:TetR/AcrR family transcriptional regulator [Luteibacter sp. CQ10]|uniref:TetR/AcrR family transcriptional regulator n=1 Tax=Luteibacter sp. CQ10 TaxID=2805821 RepID=UPI0034A4A25C
MQKDDPVHSDDAPVRVRGRPRTFDREVALDRATRLFWTKGYDSTSIADLTEVMEIGTKSLYAAFGSKEELFGEALRHYQRTHEGLVWDRFRAAPTARDAVSAFLYDSAAALTGSLRDMPRGCMATLASMGSGGQCTFQAFVGMIGGTFANVRSRIDKGVGDGELPRNVDADGLARFVETVQNGMTVRARNGATREDLEGVAHVAMAGWDAMISRATGHRPSDPALDAR